MRYLLLFLPLFFQAPIFAQQDAELYENAWKLSEIVGPDKDHYQNACVPFICSNGSSGCRNSAEKVIYSICCWIKPEENKFKFSSEADAEIYLIQEWTEQKIVLETISKTKTKLIFTK